MARPTQVFHQLARLPSLLHFEASKKSKVIEPLIGSMTLLAFLCFTVGHYTFYIFKYCFMIFLSLPELWKGTVEIFQIN